MTTPRAAAPPMPPTPPRAATDQPEAATRVRPRAARRRLLVALLVVLLVAVPAVEALLGARSSGRALDPDNPAPAGARALASLLAQDGVPVHRVATAAAASDALRSAGSGATLVVTDPQLLDPRLLSGLVERSRAVVLLGASAEALRATGSGLRLQGADESSGGAQTQTTGWSSSARPATALARPVASGGDPPSEDPVRAGCGDADAVAAGAVASPAQVSRAAAFDAGGALLASGAPATTTCFDGLYGTGTAPGGARVSVLAQPSLVSNELLASEGDAALGLRTTGSQPRVVWLMASFLDAAPDAAPPLTQLVPRWVLPLVVQLVLVALAAVVWRARRFGALVLEPLPVVVRSVETARGRAALYRASRDPSGAGGALRAALRWRLQQRLGVPPGTGAGALAAGTAHAVRTTGSSAAADRWTAPAVERLLTGPPPADDAQLAELLRDVDALEAALASGSRTAQGRQPSPRPATPPAPETAQAPEPSKTPEDLP